jgi:predicted TIM-barrel fold metal-dependent hydrolase
MQSSLGAGDLSRRDLLGRIAASGAGALLASCGLRAQTPPAGPRLIDIHRHFISPAFLKVLGSKQGKKVEGFTSFFPLGPWNNYSPARDIETMDKQGIATSLVSTTSPGTWFGNREETRGLAREMNEFGAKMASDYKGRFGLFALLPMPSVDDCLKEIEYAFDSLKADGVGLLTSYGPHYLGDAAFQPIFDELNRRKAVVYTHPIDAPCCQDIALTGVTPTTLEFPTDTARCILSLISSAPNTPSPATRYADTRFIFSHGGGTLPAIIGRVGVGGPDDLGDNLAKPAAANSRLFHLRRFYYDTAMATNPVQIGALKTIAGASQILFGTDYPFGGDAVKHRQGLEKCGLTGDELRGIFRENSAKLLQKYNS